MQRTEGTFPGDGRKVIRGAVFDVDGTLLDSMCIWSTIGDRYLRSLGIMPRENLAETFKTFTLEQAAQYYIDHYGVHLSVAEIMEGINRMIERFYFEEALLRPGVKDFLERLQKSGIKMVIATATDHYLVEAALKRCGVLNFFEKIFTCAEYGSKRKPKIYESAAAFLGTAPEDTWVFEDAFHGAETACRAGFPVLGIRDPSEENQQGLQSVSKVYLTDFHQSEFFWNYVSL